MLANVRNHTTALNVIVQVVAAIKEATQNAMAFAREALGLERTHGLRLEEVESAAEDAQPVWHITLSMIMPYEPDEGAAGAVAAIFGPQKREYKTFTVLKDTGDGHIYENSRTVKRLNTWMPKR